MKRSKLKYLALHITDGEHTSVTDDANGNYFLLSNKNIVDSNIVITNADRRINQQTLDKLNKRTKLDIGDVVVSTVGSIGKTAIIKEKPNYDFQRSVGIIKCNEEQILPEYLLYYLNLPSVQKRLIKLSKGAIQKCLFINDLEELLIDHPETIEEQKKIVSSLVEIDQQIKRNNDMVHKLQVLGNTIYSKIMTNQKTKILLGDISIMYQPETITSDKFVSNGQYPVYGAGGIIGFYDRYNHENSELMLSCRGVCGKAEISLPNSFIIGNQMVIKTKDDKMKYFLYNYLLNSDLSKIETGSVQKQITRTNLEKMPIMLPPTEIIHKHYDVLRNIYDMKTKIIIENTRLNELKENLLPILINGQLSI